MNFRKWLIISLTGMQYDISNFKIRFNASGFNDDEVIWIDDVVIKTNQ